MRVCHRGGPGGCGGPGAGLSHAGAGQLAGGSGHHGRDFVGYARRRPGHRAVWHDNELHHHGSRWRGCAPACDPVARPDTRHPLFLRGDCHGWVRSIRVVSDRPGPGSAAPFRFSRGPARRNRRAGGAGGGRPDRAGRSTMGPAPWRHGGGSLQRFRLRDLECILPNLFQRIGPVRLYAHDGQSRRGTRLGLRARALPPLVCAAESLDGRGLLLPCRRACPVHRAEHRNPGCGPERLAGTRAPGGGQRPGQHLDHRAVPPPAVLLGGAQRGRGLPGQLDADPDPLRGGLGCQRTQSQLPAHGSHPGRALPGGWRRRRQALLDGARRAGPRLCDHLLPLCLLPCHRGRDAGARHP